MTVWQVNAKRRVIWTPARTLSAEEALALVVGADPVPDAPSAPIAFGSEGPRVRSLQVILRSLDLYRLDLDGKWGNGTDTAVAALRTKTAQVEASSRENNHASGKADLDPAYEQADGGRHQRGRHHLGLVELLAAWPAISGPGMSTLAGILISILIGYFVPDRANLPVE